jgi:hypothetical protein
MVERSSRLLVVAQQIDELTGPSVADVVTRRRVRSVAALVTAGITTSGPRRTLRGPAAAPIDPNYRLNPLSNRVTVSATLILSEGALAIVSSFDEESSGCGRVGE